MNHLHQRLSELTALLATASPDRLLELARAVRAAVPPHLEDLGSVADSIVGQAAAAASMDRELLVALIEGDLAGMAELIRLAGPEPAPTPTATGRVLPAWVDQGMLADFHDAQRFGLAEIEELLLTGGSSETDRAKLARILHTLKGEAGTVGFADLEELYHALEDHLDGVTDLRPLTDDVFAVKDWVLAAVPRLVEGEPAPDGRQELLERLRAVAAPSAAPTPPPAPAFQTKGMLSQDPEVLALFGEFYDESQESLAQADELLLSFEMGAPDAPAVDALFRVFHTIKGLAGFLDLGSIGSLAHAAETLLDLAREDLSTLDGGRNDLLLRTTAMIRKILIATRDRLSQGGGEVHVDGAEALHGALVSARQHRASPVATPRGPSAEASSGGDEEGGGEAERKSPALVRETIKVDLARVDNLVETIGELVIIEAMVTSGGELSHISQRARHQLSQLSKIVRDLQRQGLALRMVPLRGVFQKMSRLVRDLSRRSNKPIQLELAGQDAEMDRSLAERLGDPLVHMIRNAVDHGVESVEKRRAAGKPELATLRLRAFHEGGNINIELSDDGKGLDRDAILAKAVGRGLVAPTAVLSDREVHELIFHPGFSTAEKVTELSGRGVGMDVVKKTVDDLRGRIQISTELGRGTTFRLVLPLTLAIIDGMLLVIGGRRYVLPTLAIVESLQPARRQVHQFATGMRVLDMRGTQLPLVDLASLLGVDSVASRDPALGFVVVVDGLNSRFGLVVDDLIGQQQVVIKHIDSSVNSLGLFSGAAILTDGHVGLILNPTALRSEEHASRGTTSLGSEVG